VTACPSCSEPAETGQLVCLSCGARIALGRSEPLGERRSLQNAGAIALLLSVVVLGAGAFGFALSELTGDPDGDVEAAGRTQQPAPSTSSGSPQTDTEDQLGASQAPRRSPLLEWPAGVKGFTVVLMTAGDRPAARRVALEAAQAGLEAGLLRSDDYDLGTGMWIVFAGRFDTQASAERQAANLGERYPGAYSTQVTPVQ
jgi:hypothetical protein